MCDSVVEYHESIITDAIQPHLGLGSRYFYVTMGFAHVRRFHLWLFILKPFRFSRSNHNREAIECE